MFKLSGDANEYIINLLSWRARVGFLTLIQFSMRNRYSSFDSVYDQMRQISLNFLCDLVKKIVAAIKIRIICLNYPCKSEKRGFKGDSIFFLCDAYGQKTSFRKWT